jgi:hypothetical protein
MDAWGKTGNIKRILRHERQTLRPTKLPLRKWGKTRSEAPSRHQSTRRTSPQRRRDYTPNTMQEDVAGLIRNFRRLRDVRSHPCRV